MYFLVCLDVSFLLGRIGEATRKTVSWSFRMSFSHERLNDKQPGASLGTWFHIVYFVCLICTATRWNTV